MIEQLPLLDKRWSKRVQTFVVPSVTVDPTAYTTAPISTHDAREFVTTHHYAGYVWKSVAVPERLST